MYMLIFLGMIVASCFLSLSNWRLGIYCLTFLAIIRDPCRKLQLLETPDQDRILVFVGLAMNIVWPCMYLGLLAERPNIFSQLGQFKPLKTAFSLFVLALIPAALVSTFFYDGGYKVALIGLASYIVPIIGLVIGYAFIKSPVDLTRFLKFYSIFNAIAITSCFFEYSGYEHPLLGGINMVWIRYRTGYIVDLMSGSFRSPDILGLHAAHVVMFSLLLLTLKSTRQHWLYLSCIAIGMLVLLMCGRRKMLAIPLVYVLAVGHILFRRNLLSRGLMLASVITFGSLIVGVSFLTQSGYIEADYSEYASSLATESVDRAESNIIGGIVESIRRSGLLGSGLGTATQGRYYVKSSAKHQFNEDGVSRLFAEFGVLGVFLVLIALFSIMKFIYQRAINTIRDKEIAFIVAGVFGIVISNGASFAYSHQAYSGDPNAMLMVAFFMGILMSSPQHIPQKK